MKLLVDQDQRFAKMRAHTATHLLHAELAKIFSHTKQAGSLVDDDYVRFDFVADRLLTPQEITEIERSINAIIYASLDVEVKETSYDEAIKLGAKAFFEDKYGDKVRVVMVHDRKWDAKKEQFLSIELCGGTHVENTMDIGCFAIVSQEAVASGIKRITAVTGPKVSEKMQEVQRILDTVVERLGIKTATQLEDKLDKVMKEYDDMKSAMEGVEAATVQTILKGKDFSSGKSVDKVFLMPAYINFKNILAHTKGLFAKENVLIYNSEGNFLLQTPKGVSAKDLAAKLGLKGGGNEQVVQGRDEKVTKLFK